jgi:RNA polymerase sigma-70 factor (ECF subfamily)
MLVTMSDSPASASAAPPAVRRTAVAVDETELLARAVAGEPAAFDRLVTIHQARLAKLVQRLLGWKSDVDDVVQDVFVDALKHLRRFDGRSSVLTWLTRIAINRCRSHQRRAWLRRFLPLPLGEGRTEEGASDRLEVGETVQQVQNAIRQLNQRDREIIVLRYLEELSIHEIAEMLKLSRGAVDVRLARARKRLETILKPTMQD